MNVARLGRELCPHLRRDRVVHRLRRDLGPREALEGDEGDPGGLEPALAPLADGLVRPAKLIGQEVEVVLRWAEPVRAVGRAVLAGDVDLGLGEEGQACLEVVLAGVVVVIEVDEHCLARLVLGGGVRVDDALHL